jgi:hypothetical protein
MMMKRWIWMLLASVLTNAALAQTRIAGRSVRLGFKIDPVFTNVLHPNETGLEKDGSKMGFSYGLMADFLFRDGRGAFTSGIEITHAGAKLKYTDANKGLLQPASNQVYDLNLQYLQIPLSIKLKTDRKDKIAWWGQFGSYLGFLMKARGDYAVPGVSSYEKSNFSSKINPINAGLLLGAGGEYSLDNRTNLFFGVGFENGFVDVTKNKDWNDGKVNLNRWALRLGVFF